MHVHFCLPRYIFCLFLYLSMYTYLCTLFCLILYLLLFYLHRFYLFLSRIRSSDVGRALIVRSVKHTKSCRHSSQVISPRYTSLTHTRTQRHTLSLRSSVTRLGDFRTIMGVKFYIRSCPNIWGLLGHFEKHHSFVSKNCCG